MSYGDDIPHDNPCAHILHGYTLEGVTPKGESRYGETLWMVQTKHDIIPKPMLYFPSLPPILTPDIVASSSKGETIEQGKHTKIKRSWKLS